MTGIALGAGGLAGCADDTDPEQTGRLLRSDLDLPQPFTLPLTVPAVLAPVGKASDDSDLYRLTSRPAEIEILPGIRTPILGYQGTFPGPTLETRRDRPVTVEHINDLPVPMVVHLHGGETPAAHDGFPTDLLLPRPNANATDSANGQGSTGQGSTGQGSTGQGSTGQGSSGQGSSGHGSGGHSSMVVDLQAQIFTGTRNYLYPMTQRAATLWYHDHRMDFTGPAVYRGLAGFHLVRDDEEDRLGLPQGARELPLMVADRAFDSDGRLNYPALDPTMTGEPGVEDDFMAGVTGDVILVNGTPWPVAEVDAARYRLRWLNASNARRYDLVLDPPPPGGKGFVRIGSDGGLLAAPLPTDNLTLSSGERVDVVVDFARYPVGTKVTVRNRLGRESTADVMRFVVARAATDDSRAALVLPAIERLQRSAAQISRTFRFRRGVVAGRSGWKINDLPFDPNRPIATIRAGDTELWRFSTDVHHPVHVHLASFQVLNRQGGPPTEADAGWKDTIDLRPTESADVLIRFPDLPGRYVLHCHNLEHEDMAMMAAFQIVSA